MPGSVEETGALRPVAADAQEGLILVFFPDAACGFAGNLEIPMFRHSALIALGLTFSPALASAQFYPTIGPPNPLYQHPAYRYQFNLGTSVPTVYGRTFVGMTAPATRAPQLFSPNLYSGPTNSYSGGGYSWNTGGGGVSSGYISGGGIRHDAFADAQRELQRAQLEYTAARLRKDPESVKDAIFEQWAYEKLGVFSLGSLAGPKADMNQPQELAKALAVSDESEVTSGDALNHILVAVIAAEATGAKGPSGFLPPALLDEVRFAGSSAAEAINLLRQAGKLPFPAAFDDPKLKNTRAEIEKDFAAAAAPLRAGKAADAQKLMQIAFTLKAAQEAVTPVIREMPFADATAARRFLNRFEMAVGAMKGNAAQTLVNPAWATEGCSVAELVKHMTKHKLLFAAATPTGGPAYLTLHKGLATYFFALTQKK